MKFDMHVATEGSNERTPFVKALERMDFTHDLLIERHVTFLKNVPVSSCPLIGVHMTKKYAEPSSIEGDLECVQYLMTQHGQVGYAHAEVASKDITLIAQEPFQIARPWPLNRLEGEIRPENKKWDLHIAIPTDTMPQELEEILRYEYSGLYSIQLRKKRDGKEKIFTVYTMQGISSPEDGRRLHRVLRDWFEDVNAPHIEMKQETYIGMFRVGDPKIVPPTVSEVHYL